MITVFFLKNYTIRFNLLSTCNTFILYLWKIKTNFLFFKFNFLFSKHNDFYLKTFKISNKIRLSSFFFSKKMSFYGLNNENSFIISKSISTTIILKNLNLHFFLKKFFFIFFSYYLYFKNIKDLSSILTLSPFIFSFSFRLKSIFSLNNNIFALLS